MATTVTYGRSEQGLSELKSLLQSKSSKKRSALSGTEYETLVKTVKKYWTGADANDFLNDLAKSVNSVKNEVSNKMNQMQSLMDTDLKEFKSFQSKNVK